MDGNTAATPGAGTRRTVGRRFGPNTKRPGVARNLGHCPGGEDNLAAGREAAPWVLAVAPGDVYLALWYRRISGSPVPGDGPADWACVRVAGT